MFGANSLFLQLKSVDARRELKFNLVVEFDLSDNLPTKNIKDLTPVPEIGTNLDLTNKKSGTSIPEARSNMRTKAALLHKIIPDYICDTLIYSIPKMLKIFKGLNFEDVLVYGAETRSSSPVRILRNENAESVNIQGLYPCGEGSGYAGGIVSSAIDGMKTAESIIRSFS